MSWDAFQREALAELGLRPYALAPLRNDAAHAPGIGAALTPALLDALARAGACGHERIATLAGLEHVHGDPQAKRALWPQLRRLRAQAR